MQETDKEVIQSTEQNIASLQAKSLFTIGCKIAEERGYESLKGIEAAQYYLVDKHHWLPSQ